MKMQALLMSAALALGTTVSGDVLAHDKGRGYDRGDPPRHEVHRHKHHHHYYEPQRHYGRDHGKHHWKSDRGYAGHHWKHDRGHGKPYWKRDHKAYRHDYRPYRYEYRYKPKYRDSWYGIHLFFGG